jgi:hypothetical protein
MRSRADSLRRPPRFPRLEALEDCNLLSAAY